MKLVSMKLDPKESKKEQEIAYEPPPYPYGMCIELNDESLDKLGIETMPEVEAVMTLTARVVVTGVRSSAGQAGESRNLSLQITDMALADGDPEKATKSLYKE